MTPFLRLSQTLSMGAILALAAAIACGFATAAAYSLYCEIQRELVDSPPDGFSEQVRILTDGTPVIVRWSHPYWDSWTFFDQDRNLLSENDLATSADGARLDPPRSGPRPRPFHRLSATGIMRIEHGLRGREDWWFISGDAPADRGYFVGYDVGAGQLAGYIGPAGFQREPIPPEKQFIIEPHILLHYGRVLIRDGRGAVYVLSDSRLLFVDLERRRVRRLTQSEVHSMAVVPTAESAMAGTAPTTHNPLAVRTPTHVETYDFARGTLLETYPIPEGWEGDKFAFYLPEQGDALFARSVRDGLAQAEAPGEIRKLRIELVRVGPHGEQSRQGVVLQHRDSGEVVSPAFERNVITAAVPAPLTAAGFALGIEPWASSTFTDVSFGEALASSAAVTWPALLIVFVLAAGLTWLADRHQRAHYLPRSFGWLAFVFVLGLPGWLGYRLHRRWPIREHAPPPNRTGIEVFDRPITAS